VSTRPRIEFVRDADHPGGVTLIMDSVLQSYIDLTDPSYLDFEYVRFFAVLLGTLAPGPLAVTHIGGGGLTVARYLHAVRPGSSQIVLEPDEDLTSLVRTELPLPRNHRIRVRPVDGVAGISALSEASADVVILDAYADGRVPAAMTTVDFFADCSRVLRADGLLLCNLVDEAGLVYVGRAAAGLREVFGEVVLIASTDVLKGRRFGNVVLAARPDAFDVTRLRRDLVRQPFPATVLDPDELSLRFGNARAFTVADQSESPEPARDGWRIR
jgi:spermidine synthase